MEEIYAILKEVRPEYDFKSSDDYVEDGFLLSEWKRFMRF